jgi:hypothetical protein
VPFPRSHSATQRNLCIALRSDLGAAAVAGPSALVDGLDQQRQLRQSNVSVPSTIGGPTKEWQDIISILKTSGEDYSSPPGGLVSP